MTEMSINNGEIRKFGLVIRLMDITTRNICPYSYSHFRSELLLLQESVKPIIHVHKDGDGY